MTAISLKGNTAPGLGGNDHTSSVTNLTLWRDVGPASSMLCACFTLAGIVYGKISDNIESGFIVIVYIGECFIVFYDTAVCL